MRREPLRTYRWTAARVTLVCAAVALTGIACDDGRGGGTPTELEGTWVGTEAGDPSTVWTFTFTGATASVSATTGEWYTGIFTLDTTATPKRLNMTITTCVYQPYVGTSSLGIYDLPTATTMTFAGNPPGDPTRPTAFVTTMSTRVWNLVKQ